MTSVLIQGMRRSGTTVFYDLLCQAGGYDAWYEPFGPAKHGRRGGGSGVQQEEFAARTRALRERFCRDAEGEVDPTYFNYGAPREARLELESELPALCRRYLREILAGDDPKLVKFVRMQDKLGELHALAPDAHLLHVVRDPRRVAVSQLYGRERLEKGVSRKQLFRKRGEGGLWASRALADALIENGAAPALSDPSDVERVLLVWRHSFRQTWEMGRRFFGDRYRLVQHESLIGDPGRTASEILGFVGRKASPPLMEWAKQILHPPGPVLHADAEEWNAALDRVDMAQELELAGYTAGAEASAG